MIHDLNKTEHALDVKPRPFTKPSPMPSPPCTLTTESAISEAG